MTYNRERDGQSDSSFLNCPWTATNRSSSAILVAASTRFAAVPFDRGYPWPRTRTLAGAAWPGPSADSMGGLVDGAASVCRLVFAKGLVGRFLAGPLGKFPSG